MPSDNALDGLLTLAPAVQNDPVAEQLAMAADQFIVLPGSRLEESVLAQASGGELRSVYAGYHWFGDWGRDTMISLEGLTLCTGRYREAGAILSTFSHYVKDGLLPNLFPEGERQALYHTVDATLWYFHAISRYSRPPAIARSWRSSFRCCSRSSSITSPARISTSASIRKTDCSPRRRGLSADLDGREGGRLGGDAAARQAGGDPGALVQRAEADGCMGRGTGRRPSLGRRARASARASRSTSATGTSAPSCLYDVIDGPDGNDASIRPNQIFALSLPHPILYQRRWEPVVERCATDC